ncbi:hypothetical protein NFI96_006378 [Prochilodus magdalenae]|nr:hypothetical protein NFI96_006378 [Prochilodus magdalenae]
MDDSQSSSNTEFSSSTAVSDPLTPWNCTPTECPIWNLFQCSENGSDTYVRIYLLPDQKWKSRMRTQVKRKTVEPVFEEKFEFSVSSEEAKTRTLDVSVKNNRMFHTRERKEIGKVRTTGSVICVMPNESVCGGTVVLIDLSQMDLLRGSIEWYELTLPGLKKNEVLQLIRSHEQTEGPTSSPHCRPRGPGRPRCSLLVQENDWLMILLKALVPHYHTTRASDMRPVDEGLLGNRSSTHGSFP